MIRFIDPNGEVLSFRTIRDFSEQSGIKLAIARQLHCGQRARIHGFCSMAKRAKKHRDRFLTKLVNTRTGEESILGSSIQKWATGRGLCANEVWKLVNGYKGKLMYQGWCLKRTVELASCCLADECT